MNYCRAAEAVSAAFGLELGDAARRKGELLQKLLVASSFEHPRQLLVGSNAQLDRNSNVFAGHKCPRYCNFRLRIKPQDCVRQRSYVERTV